MAVSLLGMRDGLRVEMPTSVVAAARTRLTAIKEWHAQP